MVRCVERGSHAAREQTSSAAFCALGTFVKKSQWIDASFVQCADPEKSG